METKDIELSEITSGNNAVTMYNLGLCYAKGEGVPKDLKKTLNFIKELLMKVILMLKMHLKKWKNYILTFLLY